MEIISSTDVIGEEIKEEARKKANLILKNADAEIEQLKMKSTERIEKLQAEQSKLYNEKIKKYKNDVFIRLPLKKFKARIEYIETLFNSASDKYFASLDMNSRLFIIKSILKNYKPILDGKEIIVKYAGFPQEKVMRLLSSLFSNCNIKEVRMATDEEVRHSSCDKGIIIEDVEKSLSCKASIESAKSALFDKMKVQLCDALCGTGGERKY